MTDGFLPPSPFGDDNFRIERLLYSRGLVAVGGCDEVGRGPLAGPVVAACVILPPDCDHSLFQDSKKINHARRKELNQLLSEIDARVGLGLVSEKTIDRINILQASLLAMKRAVLALDTSGSTPDYLLIDGKFPVPINIPQDCYVKGESKSASIAAASIVAKIHRDNLMEKLHNSYPLYNFKKNKGYPTREHRKALLAHGPCPAHRFSFKGVHRHD